MDKKIKIIILAAGLGKRMQNENPKVLLKVKEKRMIEHLRDSIIEAQNTKPIAVIGHQAERVKAELGDSFSYVVQEQQLGTAHAVMMAQAECKDIENVMVLYGDQPFIKSSTIKNIIKKHLDNDATITFATTSVPDFKGFHKVFMTFARILRDGEKIKSIREFKDATEKEKEIREVNAGCYVFKASWLWKNLKNIDKKNAQGEYYLTDLVPIALGDGEKIETVNIEPREAMGANSKEDLEILEGIEV